MMAGIARQHRLSDPYYTATYTAATNISYIVDRTDISLAYSQGLKLGLIAPIANTGTANLQYTGLARYPIKYGGAHLDTSAIDANQVVVVSYNATGPHWDMNTPLAGLRKIGSSAVTTLSGATTDITGIPPGVRKLTVAIAGLSTNGTSNLLLQIGDSGGIETGSYVSGASTEGSTTNTDAISTAGYILTGTHAAAYIWHGLITLVLTDPANNTWVCSGTMNRSDTSTGLGTSGSGYKSLSAVLSQIRITTAGGANTFDAGTMTVLYE